MNHGAEFFFSIPPRNCQGCYDGEMNLIQLFYPVHLSMPRQSKAADGIDQFVFSDQTRPRMEGVFSLVESAYRFLSVTVSKV